MGRGPDLQQCTQRDVRGRLPIPSSSALGNMDENTGRQTKSLLLKLSHPTCNRSCIAWELCDNTSLFSSVLSPSPKIVLWKCHSPQMLDFPSQTHLESFQRWERGDRARDSLLLYFLHFTKSNSPTHLSGCVDGATMKWVVGVWLLAEVLGCMCMPKYSMCTSATGLLQGNIHMLALFLQSLAQLRKNKQRPRKNNPATG